MEDYLSPGFRFYPTEEELLSFYLHTRLEGGRDDLNRTIDRIIPVLDIYQFDPWDLPQFAGEVSKNDREQWFFFVPRQESEARGGRPKRLTSNGYWKATGTTSYVYSSNNRIIGMKRTMVFYNGRAPSGTKTEWKMNEYKPIHAAGDPSSSSSSSSTIPLLSLCRIYKKTKSLRAFDRRPRQAPEMAQLPTEQQPSQHNVGDALPHQNPNPPLMGERASSTEYSSSSGDHADAHLISHTSTGSEPTNIQSSEMDFDTNDELVWDWNHMNWL